MLIKPERTAVSKQRHEVKNYAVNVAGVAENSVRPFFVAQVFHGGTPRQRVQPHTRQRLR